MTYDWLRTIHLQILSSSNYYKIVINWKWLFKTTIEIIIGQMVNEDRMHLNHNILNISSGSSSTGSMVSSVLTFPRDSS